MKRFAFILFIAFGLFGIDTNEIYAKNIIENSFLTNQYNSSYIKKHKVEDDGYEWYQLETKDTYLNSIKEWLGGEPYGAMDINGRIIIPRKYDSIVYSSDNEYSCFIVELDEVEGIYSKNGTCLISTSRGYTSAYYFKDGLFYVEKGEFKGVCDRNGKEIISPNKGYDKVYYHEEGYYMVEKGEFEGVCDRNGKEIISPNRGYKRIYYREEGYYEVKINDYVGICNIYGQELVAPTLYIDVLFHNNEFIGIDSSFDKHNLNIEIKGKSINKQIDTTSTSTSNLSSVQAPSSDLLYEGTYTVSNQGYCAEMGGYTDPIGGGNVVDVKIFNNYIIVGGIRHDYVKSSNGYNIYGDLNNIYYKVNSQTYNMSMYTTLYNQFTGGTNTWSYSMEKGEVLFNIRSNNNNYNNSIENSVNGTNPSSIRSGRTPKKCGACDGKGWISSTRGVASLGQEKWCSECKKNVPSNHYHETCPSCKGKRVW